MRFAILGTRGVPAAYGGFETFAEELGKRLIKKGVDTLVVGDSELNYSESLFNGIEIAKTDVGKPNHPLKFYFQSLQIATKWSADFILVCGVGGNMMIPFFKKKIPIAINPDGLGFKRDKYNVIQKALFYSQYLTTTFTTDYLVCDSKGIMSYYRSKLLRNNNLTVIEYGTYVNPYLNNRKLSDLFFKHSISFTPEKYHLIVSRLEPENNVEMIVKGYIRSNSKLPLIIVGNKNTQHSNELIKYENSNVVFVGGVYNKEKLQLLRAGCYSYWHGHSVGGTNPSLLEAMGSANLCVCHNNMFNRELVRENAHFFSNSVEVAKIFNLIEIEQNQEYKRKVLERAKNYYNWDAITCKYLDYAKKLIKEHSTKP